MPIELTPPALDRARQQTARWVERLSRVSHQRSQDDVRRLVEVSVAREASVLVAGTDPSLAADPAFALLLDQVSRTAWHARYGDVQRALSHATDAHRRLTAALVASLDGDAACLAHDELPIAN